MSKSKQHKIEDVTDALKKFDGRCYISVEHTTHTEITRDSDPDDKWDRNDTYTDHTFGNTFKIIQQPVYKSLEIGYLPRPNRTYYLVVAIYSTGDSFSHESNGECELIDLYKTKEDAKAVVNLIESESTKSNLILKNSLGMDYEIYAPWSGYFESLSYVQIIPVTLHDDIT